MICVLTIKSASGTEIGAVSMNSRTGLWVWTWRLGSTPATHRPYRWVHNGSGFELELTGFARLSHPRWNMPARGMTAPPEPWFPHAQITSSTGTVLASDGTGLGVGARISWEGGAFLGLQDLLADQASRARSN
jgi:hypothetical protein